ncbi:MAG: hypothetical protein ACI4OA_03040 [Selenomonadaceae bacterium]
MKKFASCVAEHFAKRMANVMSEQISFAVAAILEGLNEALRDAKGESVEGLRKMTKHDDGRNSSCEHDELSKIR